MMAREALQDPRAHFAWIRTALALERTMMAWIRTGVSLIGFGFGIVEFFDRLQQIPGAAAARFPSAPIYLGLSLIGCGVLGLVISLWEYEWTRRYLRSGSFALIAGMSPRKLPPPVVAIVVVLTFIGLIAFSAVLVRLL